MFVFYSSGIESQCEVVYIRGVLLFFFPKETWLRHLDGASLAQRKCCQHWGKDGVWANVNCETFLCKHPIYDPNGFWCYMPPSSYPPTRCICFTLNAWIYGDWMCVSVSYEWKERMWVYCGYTVQYVLCTKHKIMETCQLGKRTLS